MLRQRAVNLISSPLSSADIVTEESIEEQEHQQTLHAIEKKRAFTTKSLLVGSLVILTLLSFLTRFYCISEGPNVTYSYYIATVMGLMFCFRRWDEAHFGKFASHYLKREFYTDVHPPLGKMLVGLAGYVNGYNGTYEFTSGTPYPEWVNYVGMRMFLASFGALAVPFAFLTAVLMNLSPAACGLVAVMMLVDNGFIGISRLILLDSMLLFFTVTSTFGLALFYRYRNE